MLSPLLETQKSRNLQSLYNPSRFEICIYKPGKQCLHLHIPKRKNPHSRSPDKKRKDCGDFQCRIHRSGRNSCVMHRCGVASFRTRIRVPAHILIRLVQRLSLPYHRNYTFLLHLIKPKNAKITIVVSARRYFGYRLAEMLCASRPNNAGISRIPV